MGESGVQLNWEQRKMDSLEPSPIVQLLQRRQASRVGTKADPLLQKEAERSVTRDPLTALPFPTGEATAWLGLRNLPKTEKEIQASENIVRKNLTQLNLLYQAILEIKDHGNHEICAQNTNQGTANMYEVKEACASINTVTTGCARTTSTFPQKKERQIQESLHHKRRLNRVVRNLRYFGTTPSNVDISQTNRGVNTLPKSVSLKQIPVADAVSENSQAQACNNEGSRAEIPATQHQCSSLSTFTCTVDDKNVKIEETELSIPRRSGTQLGNERLSSATHRIGLNEQAMNLGVQMSGDLQKDQDAEDAIADLSSNDHGSSEKGGLWEAIMEFLRTISEYSLWLLRLYVGAVRPVFNARSSYWRCADREGRGWMNVVSICLALPLIFGLSMVLVWSMELAVITLKCVDEDWDYVADEALAMFQRSFTGVYPYE